MIYGICTSDVSARSVRQGRALIRIIVQIRECAACIAGATYTPVLRLIFRKTQYIHFDIIIYIIICPCVVPFCEY